MTHISATGNLARTPELREGDKGPYCYAAVIVNDRYRDPGGNWHDGEATRYDLTVLGIQAENLVRTAQASGNVRVQFSGDLTRQPWNEGDRAGVNNRVRVDDVGVSLRGNIDVAVTKRATGGEHEQQQDHGADRTAFPTPATAAVATAPAPGASAADHVAAAPAQPAAELQR